MTDELSRRTGEISAEKLALLVLRAKKKRAETPGMGRIPRRTASGPAPLSFAQQRLWVLDRLEPGSTAYNMPSLARLRGVLHVEAFERALGEIVRRHESLRTTFGEGTEGDTEPVQIVAPSGDFRLPFTDLTGLEEERRRAEERRLVLAERRPYDLERGPLFRAHLVRTGEEEHLLLLDMHHIISDGWSYGIFFRELGALYDAFLAGCPSPLPELPIQLADFAAWQREWLQGPVQQEQLAYWRDRLASVPPALELPLDRVRPAVQTHRGEVARLNLPADLAAGLRELARREGTSPFMTLLAVFQLLLSRLSGQDDVVVGSPSAGRSRMEMEELIGLFLNTLVLRTDLSGDPTFRELLGRVKDVVLGAYQYQDIPFERLLEELQPERQLSRTPIFQVLFNFVSLADLRLELTGLRVEPVPLEQADSKFDFTLYVRELPDTLRLDLVYNADLFEPERMAEMQRQLEHLLTQVIAAPETRIGELSLVTPASAALLPDPAQPLNGEWRGAVHHALSREARLRPERLAVSDAQGTAWTYGELESRANQLAGFLISHGVEKGDAVAVWAQRSAPLVQALLGTLKTGAAFLILDPAYPATRLLEYLRIGRPTAWIGVPGAPPPPAEVEEMAASLCRCRVELPASFAGLPETDPGVPVGPDDAACITFTSGSTGTPKGVVGRHGPLTYFLPWVGERFGLGEDDRFGMLSALPHDPLQRDVFTPLWFGAPLVVPDADGMAAPGYLADWARRERITVLNLTPAMMEVLLDSAENELPDLRRTFVVGDLLKKTDVEHLQRLAPNVVCVNLYGSTETQRSLSCFVVPRGRELDRLGKEVLPLGRGMEGCQLLVLNAAGRLAGVGEAGELCFRGPHLARGYLGDEALTAEKFQPGPQGDRIYRTGDLGRYLPDGSVEIAGRADSQVKLRGFRIELGEVEAALERFPGVRECVVIVRERSLVAYVVPVVPADTEPSARELRAFLGTRLPDYMVPSVFVVLLALPMTRTEKVDRRALPAPETAGADRETVAPRNPVEESLAKVWADVLRRERVGIHDNFFELGGDSIRTIQVVARSRKHGIRVSARQIFQHQTIAELAEVAELAKVGHPAAGPGPEVELPSDIYPLSPGQQGMLMVLLLSGPESGVYFDQSVVTLKGELDAALWHRAWQRVVDRHSSLRTLFVWEGCPQPLQEVRRQAELPWTELDWSGLPEPERAARLVDFLGEDRARGFDLGSPPLMRLSLIRWDDESWKMIWSFHHLIVDGWSLSRVFGEVVACYVAFREDREPHLEAPYRFSDYIAWLQRQDLGRAEVFWRGALAGFDEPTPLPYDGTGSGGEGMTYGREMGWIPPEETEALTALARRNQLTLNTLFQGAWGALLGRATGRDDVIFGSVVSGRPGEVEGIESVVGFFINVLPVRVSVGEQAVAPALAELQGHQIEQRDFEYCPLESIQAWSGLPRGSRLIESLLVFQNFPLNPLEMTSPAGFRILDAQVMGATHYPITLYVAPRNGGLDLRFDYHVSRLGAESARRLIGHLRTVLAAFLARPDSRMAELPLLTPKERLELLALSAGPAGAGGPCIHKLVREQAERTPDAPAIEAGDTVLSYRELTRRAGLLASRLRHMGIGPESVVGLCVERSPEMVVGMLGVLEAGGAYLPLDPVYPRERLSFMQEDSGAGVVLTRESFADLDAETSTEGRNPVPANGAYVIYTSGSTGKPKGVLVPHSSLVNYVLSTAEEGGIGPADRVLQFASMSFDTSAEEIYPCLTRGATLVLRDDAMGSSPEVFVREVERLGITVLDLPTAFWHELVAQDLEWPISVRLVIIGGEQAHAAQLDAWRERVGDRIRLLNTYGPTEATIVTTRRDVTGPRDFPGEVPIGRPVPGAHIHVVSRDLEPLPPGLDGELVIGGAGVARGYLGRPDLTAERFVPDPFAEGSRLYRTGDLARWLPAGELEFRGRADHQVKVRGFRIELGEIEAALRRLPGVREAAVLVREAAPGDRRIVAYVVGESAGLRSGLKKTLPDYMLPSAFVTLESLPLTPSGKVDRRALPAPGAARPDLDAGFTAPRNPVEDMLAGIFCDVLKLDRVGVDDDFFVLGGHSLLVAQVATRARQALGFELPIPEIFRRSTVARLAELVEKGGADGMPELPPLQRVPRDGRPIPLSFPQERVWFLNQLTPGGNIAYNFQFTLTFHGPLDVAVLEAAFTEMVRRHEILRTSFPSVDGRPVQVIHPPQPVRLPVVDLRGVPEREAITERLVAETLTVPFDVTQAPLIRWRLLRMDEQEWMLIQVEQHFIHDGWSYAVLLGELKALYSAFLRGEPSPLPELPIQFADFAHWQRGWMQGEAMERLLAYWKRNLAGNPTPTEIPTDRPRPPRSTFRGDVQMFPFPPELYLELRQFSRRQGFTLYMTMLAGFFSLLHRYSGQEDLLIATTIANRRTEEIEKLIGMIVNTILLRGQVSGQQDVRELLGRVRDLTLEAYAHQDMPFDRLVQELRPERQLGRNPLFQIMYNFHDAAVPDLDFGGMRAVRRVRGNRSAKVDLNVIFVPRGEQRIGMEAREEDRHAVLHWEYNTDLFDLETMQRMSRHYMTLLAGFLEDPKRPLSELPLLTQEERRQVIEDWNDTAMEERIGTLLHDAFAARAALHPLREAVRFAGHGLTYGELNARANRLAHVLRGLGVGPEVLVGLCVERSLDMMVGLLGVLKAGGAYVPLDPSYPADRLAFVLEDARIPVLLTQSSLRSRLDVVQQAKAQVIAIDEIGFESAAEPVRLADPENLAYVIYTSGSTGRPKGVGIPHRAAVNFLTSMARRPGLSEADTLVAVTTLSFDIAVLELFLPLAVGGRVEVAGRDTAADGMQLAALLASSGATAMQATPATWRVLLEAGWPGDPGLKALCGGEALPGDLATALRDRVGSLWNVYGPTETTVWSTIHCVEDELPVPIGRPIANTSAFVLDRNLEPVPQGIPGELFLGGEGVARGYIGRPDLTAERFVPDRFRGGRLYRTGDLARYRKGSVLEFLGRADHQVKVRGFRIELGEIEAVLGAQPSVGAAVVAARADAAGDSRLVAYVVPAVGERLNVPELRAALERKLPDYMVPSVFLELPKLPLTPNGKVDRKALPAPDGGRLEAEAAEYVEPRSATERTLSGIWAEVLGLERVGVRDNFFSLGGHSLSAARVLSRVRNAFAVELPLSLVFERRTIEGMVAAIEAAAATVLETPETDLLARAAVLSDSELDALLRETLANGGQL
nr:condensation domain-containing protein [uncultured bacterium]